MVGIGLRSAEVVDSGRSSRSLVRLVLVMALLAQLPATAATIEVNDTCTLVRAINAANNDTDSGGSCPPGGSGADTLELTADVELTAIHNTTSGANGLPVVTSQIAIAGGGFEISRDPSAPDFRLFFVDGPRGTLALDNVTLEGGVATGGFFVIAGGAIYAENSNLTLTDSAVENNSAQRGGAIYALETDVSLSNSTVSGNSASENGGGFAGNYYGDLTATNSTISGNSALRGGGIWTGKGSKMVLFNTTVASNTAASGGGFSDIGSFFSTTGKAYESIIGYNAGGDCSTYYYPISSGSFDGDGSCGFSNPLQGLDPTLADNGGPTRTHALLADATPIDAAGNCGLAEDQRGFPRSDGVCDSGSVEFGAAPVGGSAFGHRVQRVTCVNVTTGQSVTAPQSEGAWDCEAAGLVVSPGDRVRQNVVGAAGTFELGGTAIGLSQPRVSCENRTSGQEVRFSPAGTLTWSCLGEGLAYQPGDRVVQVLFGTAN